MMRWDEATGRIGVFRAPSNNSNGNTRDRQGRLITCKHPTRRVTRTEHDGSITVIADRFDGKPLNSPHDVVVKSDGSIRFTDPPFGILGYYEGEMAEPALPTSIDRMDGRTGRISVATGEINRPNGLAFSPDERLLDVVESGAMPRISHVLDADGERLTNKRAFYTCQPPETPDGFRVDVDGNLWCGWGMTDDLDGARVLNPSGVPIGHVHLPERCANLAFGGRFRNRLLMTASKSLCGPYVNPRGATVA